MLVNKSVVVTLTGNIQAVTSTGIPTRKFVIVNPSTNTGNVFVGHATDAGAAPSTLDATDHLYNLAPGDSVTIGEDERSVWFGEHYILSRWYLKGTNTEKVTVTYVDRIYSS